MSWLVADIRAEVTALREKGVTFEQFDVPGLEMVDGIAHSGPNVWTAWFKDPDGNMLGLTQIDSRVGRAPGRHIARERSDAVENRGSPIVVS